MMTQAFGGWRHNPKNRQPLKLREQHPLRLDGPLSHSSAEICLLLSVFSDRSCRRPAFSRFFITGDNLKMKTQRGEIGTVIPFGFRPMRLLRRSLGVCLRRRAYYSVYLRCPRLIPSLSAF